MTLPPKPTAKKVIISTYSEWSGRLYDIRPICGTDESFANIDHRNYVIPAPIASDLVDHIGEKIVIISCCNKNRYRVRAELR